MSWQAPRIIRPRSAQTRLPWWALALPTLAFAVLLALVAAPGASAASPAGSPGGLLGQIARFLPDMTGHFL